MGIAEIPCIWAVKLHSEVIIQGIHGVIWDDVVSGISLESGRSKDWFGLPYIRNISVKIL